MNERSIEHGWASLAALTMFALIVGCTHQGAFAAGNDASRFAHIEALVEHGVPYLDHSRYAWTIDRVMIDGRAYSNKPPIMAMAGAIVYSGIQTLTGWSFEQDSAAITKTLSVILVGIPSALLIGVFYLALGLHASIKPSTRWLTVAGLALGSLLTSYSGTLNNHTVAAAFLFFAFYSAWSRQFVLAAILISITTWIDVVPGIVFIPTLTWMAFEHGNRKCLTRFLLTGLVCAAPFMLANWLTVGHILLPKMVPGAVDQSSHFGTSVAAVLLPETWYYPTRMSIWRTWVHFGIAHSVIRVVGPGDRDIHNSRSRPSILHVPKFIDRLEPLDRILRLESHLLGRVVWRLVLRVSVFDPGDSLDSFFRSLGAAEIAAPLYVCADRVHVSRGARRVSSLATRVRTGEKPGSGCFIGHEPDRRQCGHVRNRIRSELGRRQDLGWVLYFERCAGATGLSSILPTKPGTLKRGEVKRA